jgi:hypothetical protein
MLQFYIKHTHINEIYHVITIHTFRNVPAATRSHWFLTHRFFYPEDGGDTFLWNVDSQKIYMAPHPRRRHSWLYSLWASCQVGDVSIQNRSWLNLFKNFIECRLRSTGISHNIVWLTVSTNISEKHNASIFRTEDYSEDKTVVFS